MRHCVITDETVRELEATATRAEAYFHANRMAPIEPVTDVRSVRDSARRVLDDLGSDGSAPATAKELLTFLEKERDAQLNPSMWDSRDRICRQLIDAFARMQEHEEASSDGVD